MTSSVANLQIGKGIVYFRPFTKLPTNWSTGTAYTTSDFVANQAGDVFKCTVAGTSTGSGTGPTGATWADGATLTWAKVDWIDLGNAPKLEWSATAETLKHKSSRQGIGTVDLEVQTTREGALNLIVDEATMENYNVAVQGSMTGSVGSREIDVYASGQSMGSLKFVGTNDQGPKITFQANYVRFQPGKSIAFIGEEFTQFEMDAKVNLDWNSKYAKITEMS